MTVQLGRRERQREATFDEIVRVSQELLASGAELSLRAVASRMGMTAPALYRYVANYQELVDLVAFEIDKAATVEFAEAADSQPADDPVARLVCASVAFRQWALRNHRQFSLVFANPVADANCVRRDAITISHSGRLFSGLMTDLWRTSHYPIPDVAGLPDAVREAVLDPLLPGKYDDVAPEERGLLWVIMQGWTMLYGVVTLEVFGHLDPRLIESGDMFVHALHRFGLQLGLDDDWDRLEPLIRSRLA